VIEHHIYGKAGGAIGPSSAAGDRPHGDPRSPTGDWPISADDSDDSSTEIDPGEQGNRSLNRVSAADASMLRYIDRLVQQGGVRMMSAEAVSPSVWPGDGWDRRRTKAIGLRVRSRMRVRRNPAGGRRASQQDMAERKKEEVGAGEPVDRQLFSAYRSRETAWGAARTFASLRTVSVRGQGRQSLPRGANSTATRGALSDLALPARSSSPRSHISDPRAISPPNNRGARS